MKYRTGDRVLIQCGDVMENMYRILPLAETLRARGMVPVIMPYTPGAGSFFLARGFECVGLGPYQQSVTSSDINRTTLPDEFFDDAFTPIYPFAFSSSGGANSELNKQRYMLRRAGVAVSRLVRDHSIDWIITWNGVTGAVANALRLFAMARSMNAGFLERGYLSGSLFFDQVGTNGASSIADGLTRKHDAQAIARAVSRRKAEVDQALQNFQPDPAQREKVIFVPLQVQGDSNILLYSPVVKTMRQLVLDALEMRNALGEGWRVVVRDHPEEIEPTLNIPYDPNLTRDVVTPLEDMLDRARIVMTVNSTVGLSAACRGAVVICRGNGIYCDEPFVIKDVDGALLDPASPLAKRISWGPNEQDVRDYLSLLFDYHTVAYADDFGDRNGVALSVFGQAGAQNKQDTPLDLMTRKLLSFQSQERAPLHVESRLSYDETLLRTYRVHEKATPKTIKEDLARIYPGLDVSISHDRSDRPKSETILVVASNESVSEADRDYLAVLDEYGYPHHETLC